MFSITPLSFDAPCPGNPREYHKPYRQIGVGSPRSEDSKLIIRIITFELTQQPTPTAPQCDGRTDRQTDRQPTVAKTVHGYM